MSVCVNAGRYIRAQEHKGTRCKAQLHKAQEHKSIKGFNHE